MNEQEKRLLIETVQKLVSEALEENAATRWLCGVILAEIAVLSPNPPEKLGELVAKISGAAAAAKNQAITNAVERACATAEASLGRRSNPNAE